jgi:hypothetical protein
MSSYQLVVCLPPTFDDLQEELTARMAPFDAAITVEPYRRYLNCTPAEFAVAARLRFDRQDTTNLTWSRVLETYHLQRGAPIGRLHTDEQGAYQMSTENPQAKWRRWEIGSRGISHFLAKPTAIGDPGPLINPMLAFGSRAPLGTGLYCDGAPLRLLDLHTMRNTARRRAAAIYQQWEQVITGTAPATPLTEFVNRHVNDIAGYPIEQALFDFITQRRVLAVIEHDHHVNAPSRFIDHPAELPEIIDEFQPGEQAFTSYMAAAVVHGSALLTVNGQWMSPVAASGLLTNTYQDRVAYLRAANSYLETLTPDSHLVILEAHP